LGNFPIWTDKKYEETNQNFEETDQQIEILKVFEKSGNGSKIRTKTLRKPINTLGFLKFLLTGEMDKK